MNSPATRTILAILVASMAVCDVAASAQSPASPLFGPPQSSPGNDDLFAIEALAALPAGYAVRESDDLYQRLLGRATLTTGVPLSPQQTITLELERFDVSGPWTQFVIATDSGEQRVASPDVILFRGVVRDHPDSWAFLGITPNSVNAYLHLAPGVDYLVAPARDAAGRPVPVIYHRQSAAKLCGPIESLYCALDSAAGATPIEPPGGDRDRDKRGAQFRVADVALDADWEFRQLFGSANDALAYMSLLTAVISTMYERDVQLKLALVYARVWNTPSDPYVTNGNTALALDEFRAYWQNNMDWLPRSIAHLLSGRAIGGGLAEPSSVCNNDLSYGVSGNLAGAFPYPLQNPHESNWDLYVVGHEMGHNFGSVHTHCFVPPIDTCAGNPPGIDCPNDRMCQVGTIMSYCHGCPGNILNIDLTVHPRCAAAMRAYFEPQCLRVARNPCYVDRAWLGVEDGTSALPFNSILEGAQYVVPSGTVRIAAGNYSERFPVTNPLNRPMILTAVGGTVRIGD